MTKFAHLFNKKGTQSIKTSNSAPPTIFRLFIVPVERIEKLPVWGYQINLSFAPDIYSQIEKKQISRTKVKGDQINVFCLNTMVSV